MKKIFDGLCRQSVQQDPEYVKKVNHLATELQDIYSGTVVCEETDKTKCYQLSPSLERVMQLEKTMIDYYGHGKVGMIIAEIKFEKIISNISIY